MSVIPKFPSRPKKWIERLLEKISQLSNPNLLINPDFKINQRGQTTYNLVQNKYCVDRWKMGHLEANVTVVESGINVEFLRAGQFVQQTEEIYFPEDTYITASIKFEDNEDIDNFHLVIYQDEIWSAQKHFIYANDKNIVNTKLLVPKGLHSVGIGVYATNALPVTLNWAKLEIGEFATPFVAPDPAIELVKCQRYYWKSLAERSVDYHSPILLANNGRLYLMEGNPTSMRIFPTVKVDGVTSSSKITMRNTFDGSTVTGTFSCGTLSHSQLTNPCWFDFTAESGELKNNCVYEATIELDAEIY